MTEQAHVFEDIPAYAIDALDSPDRERLERHIAHCPLCEAELRTYRELVAGITLSAPLLEPPARLKQAILAQTKPSPQPRDVSPARTGFWTVLAGWLRPRTAMAIGGGLILILLVSNLVLWKQVNDLSAMQRHGYASVLLNGTDKAPNARGMVVYTQDGMSGFMVVNGLKSLPEGKQYQLWLVKSGVRSSGGVFSVAADGYQVMEVESPILLTAYDSFGITIEPAGGSPSPTGDKVLGGSF